MNRRKHLMAATTTFLAALLAVLLLAPVAAAEQEAGTTSLPGSNGAIAFVSNQDTSITRFQVFRMNSDGFGQTRLSDLPGHNWDPTWSPDGRKIAFTSDRPGSDETTDWDVWRMRATDGANPTNLTDNAAALDFDPEWQPVPKDNTSGDAGRRTVWSRLPKEALPSAGPSLWPRPAG